MKARNCRCTLCTSRFRDKIRRERCRQDVRGDLFSVSLRMVLRISRLSCFMKLMGKASKNRHSILGTTHSIVQLSQKCHCFFEKQRTDFFEKQRTECFAATVKLYALHRSRGRFPDRPGRETPKNVSAPSDFVNHTISLGAVLFGPVTRGPLRASATAMASGPSSQSLRFIPARICKGGGIISLQRRLRPRRASRSRECARW